MNTTTWHVTATPIGNVWHVTVAGLTGATQALSENEIEPMARDFIAAKTSTESNHIKVITTKR